MNSEGTTTSVHRPPQVSPSDIAKFLVERGLIDKDITNEIKQHLKYNTILYLKDKQGLYAVARWNIYGDIAEIIDTAIREDKERKGILYTLIRRGLKKFPYVNYITFKRGLLNRGFKLMSLTRFKRSLTKFKEKKNV